MRDEVMGPKTKFVPGEAANAETQAPSLHHSCKKICFVSRSAAKKKIKLWNRLNTEGPKLTEAYFCEDCQSWHITSQSKDEQRRRKHQKLKH